MEYPENIETSWILGVWGADRGTLAKGVVALVNTKPEILNTFKRYCLKNFDITKSKFRQRILRGYGVSTELYFTRLPARRFLENLMKNRSNLKRENLLAYFAGRVDGDGNVHAKSSSLAIFYSLKEIQDAKIDKMLIEGFDHKVSISVETKVIRLRILKPRFFSSEILPYIVHNKKKKEIKLLIRKRAYGS